MISSLGENALFSLFCWFLAVTSIYFSHGQNKKDPSVMYKTEELVNSMSCAFVIVLSF